MKRDVIGTGLPQITFVIGLAWILALCPLENRLAGFFARVFLVKIRTFMQISNLAIGRWAIWQLGSLAIEQFGDLFGFFMSFCFFKKIKLIIFVFFLYFCGFCIFVFYIFFCVFLLYFYLCIFFYFILFFSLFFIVLNYRVSPMMQMAKLKVKCFLLLFIFIDRLDQNDKEIV